MKSAVNHRKKVVLLNINPPVPAQTLPASTHQIGMVRQSITSRKNPVRISLQWRDKRSPALWPLAEASRCAKTTPSAVTQRAAPPQQVRPEEENLTLDLRRTARL